MVLVVSVLVGSVLLADAVVNQNGRIVIAGSVDNTVNAENVFSSESENSTDNTSKTFVNLDKRTKRLVNAPKTDRRKTSTRPAAEIERVPVLFVTAANGKALIIVEEMGEIKSVPVETSLPVFKAFGLTSDGQKLLYTASKKGIPSGELYVEDLATGKRTKVTSHIVLEAALSPADDTQVAYTFASGEGFGLAFADLRSESIKTRFSKDVFPEIVQWSESGDGIHYFNTSRKSEMADLARQSASDSEFKNYVQWNKANRLADFPDEKLQLDRNFAPVDLEKPIPASSLRAPLGFPLLERDAGVERGQLSIEPDKNAKVEKTHRFRTVAPGGKYEIVGSSLVGAGGLSVRNIKRGETFSLNGLIVKVLHAGVLMREFTGPGTKLKFVDWNGHETALGGASVNYNIPVQSGVVTQGGGSYASPGNCLLTSHFEAMDYAYDFENSTVGAHALASASGLVVFTVSSVTCNQIDADCGNFNPNGCPGTFLGNLVIIQHADGTYTKYAHMQTNSPQVAVGTTVDQGLYIGRQGNTGAISGNFNGCGDHVHFQRQMSPDIFGQAIPVDFADVAVEPLACATSYTSASVEISHSISPASQNFGIAGGNGTVNVTSTGGTWSVINNNSWITITDAGSGSGNDTVAYSVANNSASGPTHRHSQYRR